MVVSSFFLGYVGIVSLHWYRWTLTQFVQTSEQFDNHQLLVTDRLNYI